MKQNHQGQEAIRLLGVRIDDFPLEELLLIMTGIVSQKKKVIVSNVNVQAINIAFEQVWFQKFLNQSDIVFCDGYGIWLGGLLKGRRFRHRYTPPDWIDRLGTAGNGQMSFYFLGAQPGIAERASMRLQKRLPEIRILGTHDGYFNKSKDSHETSEVISLINQLKPNILLVGFGMPMQERWIMENWNDLQVNIVMPVGALFDYLAGELPRSPRWMTEHGLEWLGRLIIEPGRLWKRYLVGNPLFLWRVFIHEMLGIPIQHKS
jgi:N-acetylglucosaminyldiphosphoundecaprenol N-acetyl-beta-D-mannosaminyltransferase